MQATAALQRHLDQLIVRVPHLQQVLVTDKEGIEIAQALDNSLSVSPLSSALPYLYAVAAEQAGKLGIGHNQYILTTYANHTVLQINLLPVVVTIVASPDVNVGLLVNAIPELRVKLEATRQTVAALVNDMAKDRQQ